MTSPARRHYQRITAAKAAGDAQSGQPQGGDQYELHAAALWEARRTLKGIKSTEAKIAKKRELLPEFDAYVAGVLDAGNGAQDDVLMTVMLWRFDIGDLDGGLAIAEYAINNGLETPDRFERDTPSLVAEQVAEEALKQLEEDESNATGLVDQLTRAEAITQAADMHDPIRAKLHKAIGYALRDAGAAEDALDHLKRALSLNDRVGVKKDIEKLERFIKQQNTSQGDNAQG
ncbi:Phage small terminase subunit [Modicisalibacter ilicicola DSM 19980]|uniref:Phage small terminase subunit n=1 Tax=Modicisalibacter ilicicola DSM 19980 TaxID=1121942 RepID=A0A1M4Y505_9GAMM|nr:phage terminase small subunit [Halomonas ilicicola]SHF00653.1 Phage small terminase subunit [Halomonas ilicicola DSM 19980]